MKVGKKDYDMMCKYSYYVLTLAAIMTLGGCSTLNVETSYDRFWSYASAARKADANQQYDLAAEYCAQAINFAKTGYAPNLSWTYYYDLSQDYVMQGRYELAAKICSEGLMVSKNMGKDVNGFSTVWNVALNHCYLGDIYREQGKCAEALDNYEQAIKEGDESERLNPLNAGFTAINIYSSVGKYYDQLGQYDKAKQYFQEVLDTDIKRGALGKDVAIAKNNLALAYYHAGDEQTAEKLLGGAAGINAHSFVAFPTDLAVSLAMLGRIAEHRGDSGTAQQIYQSARESLHMDDQMKDHPVYKVEEADVLNQIGRFQLHQGNPEEAAKAYNEAIALRQETGTLTHPNCADAHKGLADVAAYRNELTSATSQAEAALKILDASVVPTHPRIAPELVALAAIYHLSGHPEQAAPLNARLEAILQKSLGPWREDIMETAALYAGLLTKAGKNEEAGHLGQLAIRLKSPPTPPASVKP